MSIIDSFISLFVPHECLLCSAEGALICVPCVNGITPAPSICYVCTESSSAGRVCCTSSLTSANSPVLYDGVYKDLLWGLKSNGMQAAARSMAAAMKSYVARDYVLVPVPTTNNRVRQRGYDQALLITRELSRQTGVPYRTALTRHGNAHQVGAGRAERKRQLTDAYSAAPVRGLKLLLIDDVLTTGATLEAAAVALLQAGAAEVHALTFARA